MTNINQPQQQSWERVAKAIYEATRIEARWSERSIVPEKWEDRDEKFRKNMVDIVVKYLAMDKLPTPEEAHDSWTEAYLKMGWKYGKARDIVKKTHPDMVPFNDLPKDEKDKDSIFLSFVWLAKDLISNIHREAVEERDREWREIVVGLILQFGYRTNARGGIERIGTGGVGALEDAFDELGLDDYVKVSDLLSTIKEDG